MVIEYRKEGQIAFFTISRPEGTNSLNSLGMQELSEAMLDFCDDPELRTGIITGKGKRIFCAGADLKELAPTMQAGAIPQGTPPMPQRGLKINKPLIAAINGLAVGGGLEIALACDIRIAAENARFGLPEVTTGLIPGWGGTQRLPRLVPWCKAAEMILTGKLIDAREAYRIFLVNEVVPQEILMSTAMDYAEAICRASPSAVQAAREAMLRGTEMPLDKGLELENELVSRVLKTQDFQEGLAAYLEKRKPVFTGR
jgi:enoyl-CoA hydratase/carnithine racemase